MEALFLRLRFASVFSSVMSQSSSPPNAHASGSSTPDSSAPWVITIPLGVTNTETAVVLLHEGKAQVPAEGLSKCRAFVPDGKGGWYAPAKAANGRWGYINADATWRLPPTLEDVRGFSDDGFARFRQGGQWGFLDRNLRVVIEAKYEGVLPMYEGLTAIEEANGKWRLMDAQERFIGESRFARPSQFDASGLARAWKLSSGRGQDFCGFINRQGEWVIPPTLTSAGWFGDYDVTDAQRDGNLWGLINTRGEWVVEPAFRSIESFHEGVARTGASNYSDGYGLINTRGELLLEKKRHLSDAMRCGWISADDWGIPFINQQGEQLKTTDLCYSEGFRTSLGAAVSLKSFKPGGRHEWGLLKPTGEFHPFPADLVQPLLNRINVMGEATFEDVPLLRFLTDRGEIAWVNLDQQIVCRARYEGGRVALYSEQGERLWQSGLQANPGDCRAPELLFQSTPEQHLDPQMSSTSDILPLVDRMVGSAEKRLHELARGEMPLVDDETLSYPVEAEGDHDYEEEVDWTELGQNELDRRHCGILRRVARAFLDEIAVGAYGFPYKDREHAVGVLRDRMLALLTERFGPARPDPAWAFPDIRLDEKTHAWVVTLQQPLPGMADGPSETRQLWVGLIEHLASSDGDMSWELWMMVAPSRHTLQAAQAARKAVKGTDA